MTSDSRPPPENEADEISALIITLHQAEQRLEELTGGEVDTVADREGRTFVLQRAQSQLRQGDAARQTAILDALPANIALLDSRGVIVSVNEPWRQFGSANGMTDPSCGLGANYLEVCERASGSEARVAERVAAGIRSILEARQTEFSLEYECHSPSEQNWYLLTVSPLGTKHIAGAVVMHSKITSRIQAERALETLSKTTERRELMLSSMLGSLHDFAYLFDSECRFLFASQSTLDLWGFPLEFIIGKTFVELGYPPDLAAVLERHLKYVLESGQSVTDETEYVSPRGARAYYEYVFSPVVTADGKVEMVVGSSRDTTARRLAENELRETNLKFEQLANNIDDVFWIRSPDMGVVQYISPAFERIWGRPLENLSGSPELWSDWVLLEDRKRVTDLFSELTREKEKIDVEYRIVRPDGEVRWVRSRGFQVRDDSGTLIRIIGIVTDTTEKQQAAHELRNSLNEFRLLAEAMPQIVWITDAEGLNTFFNQHWMDYTGLSLEESLGEGWLRPFHPDDRAPAMAAWKNAMLPGRNYSIESRLRRADGLYRWWLIRGLPIKDARGQTLKWFGTCTDIHDLKLAELEIVRSNQELRESELRFTKLLDNVDMLSLMLDRTGRVAYCNDYLLKLTKWSRSEVIGQDWFDLFIPHSPGDARPATSILLSDLPAAWHDESEILTRSGEQRLIRWNNTRLHSADGDAVGTASIGVDITDSRRAEASLRLQSAALNAADNAIAISSPERNIVWVNDAFTRLTGYSAEDAVGRTGQQLLLTDDSNSPLESNLSSSMLKGKTWTGEVTSRRKDGVLYPASLTVTPVLDSEGAITSFISIRTDLTASRLLEQQLRHAQKMDAVGQLAAGVSHEFNNLLQALMSMSAVMRFRAATPEISEIGAGMEALIRRGANLTRQLLLFSRQGLLAKTAVDLGKQVTEASQMLRHLIPETLSIVLATSPEPLTVQGDAGQIQQVLLNLALNARDAMGSGGILTLRTGREAGKVFMEVEDTGEGMSESTLAHLFEPFFTTKEAGKGTGLGLAVAHGIVEQHGGHIEVHSQPNIGSRFRIFFPAVESVAAPPVLDEIEPDLPTGTERILLVEDETTVREALSMLLETLGYEVIVSASAEEAISLSFDRPPALLLSDVTLPGMTGLELAGRLCPRWPDVKVVLMSGYVEESMRQLAETNGWHFLQKPFELADLAEKLQLALREHRDTGPVG